MKREETGRKRKTEGKKPPKTKRNWMILKETGRNSKKQEKRKKLKETERNRKKQD